MSSENSILLKTHLLVASNELRRICVPIFCPWETRPFEQDKYPTALLHAVGTCSKAYMLWLLRHGGASVMDKISTRHNLLQAVMRSRSLHLIKFFFNGLQPDGGGTALLPPQYSKDGGSEVLRLFFDANVEGPEAARLLLPQGQAKDGKRSDCTFSVGEDWQQDEVINENEQAQPFRILNCYEYLLSAYPDAHIPLQRSFFEVFIEHVKIRGIDSSNRDPRVDDLIDTIIHEHESRFSRHGSSYVSRKGFSTYLLNSPADSLAAEDVAAIMSLIPGKGLDCFSPGLLWLPCRSIWLLVLSDLVLTISLWLTRKLIVYLVSTGPWSHSTDDIKWGDWWVFFILLWIILKAFAIFRFFVRFLLTIFMLATFYLVGYSLSSIAKGVLSLAKLRRFGSLSRPFLTLTMSLAFSACLLLFLCLTVGIMSFWLKQEGGIILVPYVF